MFENPPWFIDLACWILPLLTAVSWREAIKTHACHYRGDTIAKMIGLGSFSLTKNLDAFGSALAPILLIIRNKGYVYGWAQGIEIRENFLNKGKFDVVLIILIALLSNFAMAAGWALVGKLGLILQATTPKVAFYLLQMGKNGIEINLMLIIAHLIPIPPMDTSYLVRSLLPQTLKMMYVTFDYVGQYILFTVIFIKLAHTELALAMNYLQDLLFSLIGFSI